ncbi:MAG: tetratricopeptide repeat protein [Bacteroidota bacterium]
MGEKNTKKKNSKGAAMPPKNSDFTDKYHIWFLVGIIILTAFLYSNSIQNDFTSFDDRDYIIDNPYLKDFSITGIKNIFTSFYAANYHPFTTLMWAAEYNIFGNSAHTYHLVNMLFHLLNIVLVFYFVKNLLNKNPTALLVALLFAVHPMHVESVSWISERKDVLYTFFFMAALIFYLKYNKNKFSLKFLSAAFLMFLLSLLSKSAAVILPVLFFIIDYYLKRNFSKRLIFEKLPFLALSLTFGIVALMSQKEAIQAFITPDFPFIDRIFFASYAVAYYLLMAVFPFHFSALHFYPDASENMLPFGYYFSVLVIIAMAVLIIKAGKHRRLYVLCFGFFLAGISLVIQLIPVGQAIVAERYTYVPYIGLFIVMTEFMLNATSGRKKILLTLLACLTLYFCFSTYQRNFIWKNSISLFKDVYEKYPDSYYSSYALGNAYNDAGNVENAVRFYTRSIEINPDFIDSYNNRGVMRNQIKDYSGAIADLTIALKYPAATTYTYFNRGMAYYYKTEYENAISDFDEAVRLKDDFTDAFIYRANAMSSLEKYEEALIDYDNAIELDPGNGLAFANRARTKYFLKNASGACNDWQTAVDLGFTEAKDMLKEFCGKK